MPLVMFNPMTLDFATVPSSLLSYHTFPLFVVETKSKAPENLSQGRPLTLAISKEWSIHPEINRLFDLPGFDPFTNPSCRMHACDHGILVKVLDMVIKLITIKGATTKREFDNR